MMRISSVLAFAVGTYAAVDQAVLGTTGEALEQCLIEVSPGVTTWVTEDEKWALKREGKSFMDITYGTPGQYSSLAAKKSVTYPKATTCNDTVLPMFKYLDKDNMYHNLDKFSSFHTRYYKSDYGKQSSAWLFDKVNGLIEYANASQFGVKAETFSHPWGQNSIIATIPGRSNKTVVIGAHQDSINLFLPSILAAPGADDDGSGTVTILEAFKVLLRSQAIIKGEASNTIEFHWYSAEEGGLLGSQAIFSSYEAAGRDIKAMLQQDMTGYIKGTLEAGKAESVGVITDFVDPGLTEFLKKVITTYCDIPYIETKCGYACSDHASASKAGYPSAFIIESEFKYYDRRIHTTEDTIDRLDFDHMLQHARLTLGTVYELGFAKF